MILKKMDDEQAFDAFVEAHPYAHYMKTSMWGHNQEHTKGYTCTMLGFMEDDKLTGTAMVLRGRSVGHPFLYIPKGPCIDYTDEKTVREAFSLLKEYAESCYTDAQFEEKHKKYTHAQPFTKESLLYREIFEQYYPEQSEMIADFWMPNKDWEGCNVDDPSARVLSNYGASGK